MWQKWAPSSLNLGWASLANSWYPGRTERAGIPRPAIGTMPNLGPAKVFMLQMPGMSSLRVEDTCTSVRQRGQGKDTEKHNQKESEVDTHSLLWSGRLSLKGMEMTYGCCSGYHCGWCQHNTTQERRETRSPWPERGQLAVLACPHSASHDQWPDYLGLTQNTTGTPATLKLPGSRMRVQPFPYFRTKPSDCSLLLLYSWSLLWNSGAVGCSGWARCLPVVTHKVTGLPQ